MAPRRFSEERFGPTIERLMADTGITQLESMPELADRLNRRLAR